MEYTLKESHITLDRLRFYAFHGVLPQERTVGGDYELTLRMGYDVSRAMETDDVKDTLNYAEAYEVARREMQVPSRLLEHVAGRIARNLFKHFPAMTSLHLRLTKVNPPISASTGGASVELHLTSTTNRLS